MVKKPKVRTFEEHLHRNPLEAHFAEVMFKHHPDADANEIAAAMGGHATFLGEIEFDDYDDEEF